MKNIALVDDHKLFLNSLEHFISSQIKEEVKLTCFNSPKLFWESFAKNKYDLILMDLEMPEMNGAKLIDLIKSKDIKQKVIVISMYYNPQIAYKLYQKKVDHFVPKNIDTNNFVDLISGCLNNQNDYFDFSDFDMTKFKASNNRLSSREMEIIVMISKGYTSDEISESLFLSVHTVRTHIRNILTKKDVKSTKELITLFQKEGLEHIS
jgi:DNA-binding NarL/FixJ family response regulator